MDETALMKNAAFRKGLFHRVEAKSRVDRAAGAPTDVEARAAIGSTPCRMRASTAITRAQDKKPAQVATTIMGRFISTAFQPQPQVTEVSQFCQFSDKHLPRKNQIA